MHVVIGIAEKEIRVSRFLVLETWGGNGVDPVKEGRW